MLKVPGLKEKGPLSRNFSGVNKEDALKRNLYLFGKYLSF